MHTPTNDELAHMMRQFRRDHDINTASAGEYLGLSGRTVENIEQGRGFNAGRVLGLALALVLKHKPLGDPIAPHVIETKKKAAR